LDGADLRGVCLHETNLDGAHLKHVDLHGVDLYDANLRDADLREVNLRGADLRGANLNRANLCDADLCETKLPAPSMVLLAQWGKVSNALCIELMRYEAANCPDPKVFDRWGEKGFEWDEEWVCPYVDCDIDRAAHFDERSELWSPGSSMRPYDLMAMVLKEKCKWDGVM
jgi:hypothetical protein